MMLNYTLRRLNLLLFTLLLLTLLSYGLEYRLAPGLKPEFLGGYVSYLHRLLTGHLGISTVTGRPVIEAILHNLPPTLELCLAATLLASIGGILLGTLSALNQGRRLDLAIQGISLIGSSIPVYWLAQLFIMFFAMHLRLFPSSGQMNLLYEIEPKTGFVLLDCWLNQGPERMSSLMNALEHLFLPALALALLPMTSVTRLVRTSMIDVLKQNYIKAAFSRGWSPWTVIWRHGLHNALPPILPQLSLQFGVIITSAIIIEQVFEWPGMGQWLITSIMNRDYVAIQASVLLISGMLIILNILTELVSNLFYPAQRKELYGQQG